LVLQVRRRRPAPAIRLMLTLALALPLSFLPPKQSSELFQSLKSHVPYFAPPNLFRPHALDGRRQRRPTHPELTHARCSRVGVLHSDRIHTSTVLPTYRSFTSQIGITGACRSSLTQIGDVWDSVPLRAMRSLNPRSRRQTVSRIYNVCTG
jgi:hypothetical protein